MERRRTSQVGLFFRNKFLHALSLSRFGFGLAESRMSTRDLREEFGTAQSRTVEIEHQDSPSQHHQGPHRIHRLRCGVGLPKAHIEKDIS